MRGTSGKTLTQTYMVEDLVPNIFIKECINNATKKAGIQLGDRSDGDLYYP